MKLTEVKRRSAVSPIELEKKLKEANTKFRLHLLELVGSGIAPGPFKSLGRVAGQKNKFFKSEDLPSFSASAPEGAEHQAVLYAYISEAHGDLKMNLSYTGNEGAPGINDIIGKLREFGKKQGTVARIDRSNSPRVGISIEFSIGGI